MSGEALGHAGEGLWDPPRSYGGHRETCDGGNFGCPGPPLSILDASKQITDKLDSYQTGSRFSITPSETANIYIHIYIYIYRDI